MDPTKYLELLKEKLTLHMQANGCTIFKQGGVLCHRSKVGTEFLKKNKISVLEWPGNSQYLNPMKAKVAHKQSSSAEKFGSLKPFETVRFLHMRLRKEGMFYLTTHSTHYIYGYMVSDIW